MSLKTKIDFEIQGFQSDDRYEGTIERGMRSGERQGRDGEQSLRL